MVYLLLFEPISRASAWEAALDRCTIRAAAAHRSMCTINKEKATVYRGLSALPAQKYFGLFARVDTSKMCIVESASLGLRTSLLKFSRPFRQSFSKLRNGWPVPMQVECRIVSVN